MDPVFKNRKKPTVYLVAENLLYHINKVAGCLGCKHERGRRSVNFQMHFLFHLFFSLTCVISKIMLPMLSGVCNFSATKIALVCWSDGSPTVALGSEWPC